MGLGPGNPAFVNQLEGIQKPAFFMSPRLCSIIVKGAGIITLPSVLNECRGIGCRVFGSRVHGSEAKARPSSRKYVSTNSPDLFRSSLNPKPGWDYEEGYWLPQGLIRHQTYNLYQLRSKQPMCTSFYATSGLAPAAGPNLYTQASRRPRDANGMIGNTSGASSET